MKIGKSDQNAHIFMTVSDISIIPRQSGLCFNVVRYETAQIEIGFINYQKF